LLAALVPAAQAQPREGKTRELSVSGSYQRYSSGSSSSSSAFLISPRLGIFVHRGFEIEPEVLLMFATGATVYVLNGNVSYNFVGEGKAVPFLLLGYGIANTVPLFNIPTTKVEYSVGVLNVGAGVKAFLTEDIALRFEYRYQNFSGDGGTTNYSFSGYSYSITRKIDVRLHTVQFGLSVLL